MIREVVRSDAGAIADIYNHYVRNTDITFEIEPVSSGEMAARIEKNGKIGPFLVYEEGGEIVGYAYVAKFRERKAYEHTVESTVYVRNGCGGKEIGTKLYTGFRARPDLLYLL
jgi:phosphinothricin acetyltransferase